MSRIDDYDVLSNLGSDSCFYKVKNKATAEICVWRAINIESLTDHQLKVLLKAINDEKQFKHQNTVQVYSHIIDDAKKTLYIIMKHYTYGNLKNIIELCKKRNESLSEGFLWRLLYNIVCVLKLKNCHGLINLENIFVDVDYNAKVYYLDITTSSTSKCLLSVGTVLYQLCTLQLQPQKIKSPLQIPSHYSENLLNIITLLLKDSKKLNFDHILCHPTVLLNSTNHDEIFMKIRSADTSECHCNFTKLENLKNREIALKYLEKKLTEKELILNKRERMLTIMENEIKEKMCQAELHLEKAKQTRHLNSGTHKKLNYDNLDSTLSAAECDETIVLPTSAKINLDNIKPHKFARSLSERRIRFKGHSPLKNTCNINTECKSRTSQVTECIGSVKTRKKCAISKLIKRKSKLFEAEVDKENDQMQPSCRPISWSEEAKRQAFDMLRVMNAAEMGRMVPEIKHTHL